MAQIVFEIVGRVAIELIGAVISGAINSSIQESRTKRSTSSSTAARSSGQQRSKTKPTALSQKTELSPIQHSRAVLTVSSDISFGNDCERLVNIAFQTSQTFSKIMDTYADVIRYIRQELAKHYADEYFHIIIGDNDKFAIAVDDSQHYAEIKQDRYSVVIFSTKTNSQTKLDTHDANSQMSLSWTNNN